MHLRGLFVQLCAVEAPGQMEQDRQGLRAKLSWFPLVEGDATSMVAGSTPFFKITVGGGEDNGVADVGRPSLLVGTPASWPSPCPDPR